MQTEISGACKIIFAGTKEAFGGTWGRNVGFRDSVLKGCAGWEGRMAVF